MFADLRLCWIPATLWSCSRSHQKCCIVGAWNIT